MIDWFYGVLNRIDNLSGLYFTAITMALNDWLILQNSITYFIVKTMFFPLLQRRSAAGWHRIFLQHGWNLCFDGVADSLARCHHLLFDVIMEKKRNQIIRLVWYVYFIVAERTMYNAIAIVCNWLHVLHVERVIVCKKFLFIFLKSMFF